MLIFMAIMVLMAAVGSYLTERVDRPRRRLEDQARRTNQAPSN